MHRMRVWLNTLGTAVFLHQGDFVLPMYKAVIDCQTLKHGSTVSIFLDLQNEQGVAAFVCEFPKNGIDGATYEGIEGGLPHFLPLDVGIYSYGTATLDIFLLEGHPFRKVLYKVLINGDLLLDVWKLYEKLQRRVFGGEVRFCPHHDMVLRFPPRTTVS